MYGSANWGYKATMKRFVAIAVLFALALAATSGASARTDSRRGDRRGEIISLEQALGSVRQRFPGKLLDADLRSTKGGREVYVIRMLQQNGRIRVVVVDGRSGEIIGVRGRDGR